MGEESDCGRGWRCALAAQKGMQSYYKRMADNNPAGSVSGLTQLDLHFPASMLVGREVGQA